MNGRYFMLGGIDFRDLGVYVSDADSYDAPTRDVEAVEVPGRNGCLYIDNGRYNPITVTYECYMENFEENIELVKEELFNCVSGGAAVLEDSAHDDEYRMAHQISSLTISSTSNSLDVGTFKVSFECGPERWLYEGDGDFVLEESGEAITNPTYFEAKPLLYVVGYGTLQVGDTTIIIAENDYGSIYIDCEMMDCYTTGILEDDTAGDEDDTTDDEDDGTINCNMLVTLTDFPTLGAGETAIVWDDTITSVTVTPRWWRI